VDFGLVGAILLGSIPGVWIGSNATVRIPTGWLRTALGVVLICSSLALFNKAGAPLPFAVLLALPTVLILSLAAQWAARRARGAQPASSSVTGAS
jgi:hypothetical protein